LVYSPVSSGDIVEALIHVRDLFRRIRPSTEHDFRAAERREAATKDLLSNLPRTGEHPTLRTLVEIAEIYSLTLEGAHSLFGYHLEDLNKVDAHLNGSRTHIFESYPFKRDLLIDVPARLAPAESFTVDGSLRDLVLEWQTDIPLRVLEGEGWEKPGTFYVRVGTEDSFGSSIPAGSVALVEPISEPERVFPNPRSIYLLQFVNGYRCSHCVVTRGRLLPFSTGRTYFGREEFVYPGSVRIVGRIRIFALSLPMPEYPVRTPFSPNRLGGDLILPWEHRTRDRLFMTKHQRFKRPKDAEVLVHEFLMSQLQADLSARSKRRYRRSSSSDPHVSGLIQLTLAHMARYTDALRAGGSWHSDRKRFSLDTLLRAGSLEEASSVGRKADLPTPTEVWKARRDEFGGWPHLLSAYFPKLHLWENSIVRLAQEHPISGLDPALVPGSFLLLEHVPSMPGQHIEKMKHGWARPIYVLRKGFDIICGYLERDGSHYAVLSGANGEIEATFHAKDLRHLSRVIGAAVPV